jgi:molybdenum cofactor biosynthesis enzyme MoaA
MIIYQVWGMRMSDFLCPLPWMSLSFGPQSIPRVCCHQSGKLLNETMKSFSDARKLKHNEKIQNEMLNKKVPSECHECFEIESAGCQSPRQQYIEKFPLTSLDKTKVEYLDITVDNRCNLECLMCSPFFSHRLNTFFSDELKQQVVEKWELNLTNEEIKELLKDLKMLTLTGGEPLLSHKALSLLRFISSSEEAHHIDLRLFSNATSIPGDLEGIFKNFRSVEFILSLDSIGEIYEMIRYPAKWNEVEENIKKLQAMNLSNTVFNFHSVVMATNWDSLVDLIEYYQSIKINMNSLMPIWVEVEMPRYLHPTVLPKDVFQRGLEKIEAWIKESESSNDQVKNLKKLLDKIKNKNYQQNYIEYKAYMSQVKLHRSGQRI